MKQSGSVPRKAAAPSEVVTLVGSVDLIDILHNETPSPLDLESMYRLAQADLNAENIEFWLDTNAICESISVDKCVSETTLAQVFSLQRISISLESQNKHTDSAPYRPAHCRERALSSEYRQTHARPIARRVSGRGRGGDG